MSDQTRKLLYKATIEDASDVLKIMQDISRPGAHGSPFWIRVLGTSWHELPPGRALIVTISTGTITVEEAPHAAREA